MLKVKIIQAKCGKCRQSQELVFCDNQLIRTADGDTPIFLRRGDALVHTADFARCKCVEPAKLKIVRDAYYCAKCGVVSKAQECPKCGAMRAHKLRVEKNKVSVSAAHESIGCTQDTRWKPGVDVDTVKEAKFRGERQQWARVQRILKGTATEVGRR